MIAAPLVQRSRSDGLSARQSQHTAVSTHRITGPEIVLDISRLLARSLHPSPTGIDRVELAYARMLQRLVPGRLLFSAVHPTGIYGRLPFSDVERFLDRTEARWEFAGAAEPAHVARNIGLGHCWSLRPRRVDPAAWPRIVLQASPHHLDRPNTVARKLALERARFVCLMHDVIPVSHPEYARPDGLAKHQRRLQTLETHASGILTNSHATMVALLQHGAPPLRALPSRVAHLGVDHLGIDARHGDNHRVPGLPPANSYFVCIGTIEPRKNHLLLLNLWRSIVDAIGPSAAPHLILVGRRGWENENVIDMLDRCPGLRGIVHERPQLPDNQLRALLQHARALLMPSFAEGFGLPVGEALAVGVPVIASDIPAHREVGGTVPDYIDPVDGMAWRTAVLDYHAPASARRSAQIDRLAAWRAPTWAAHMEITLSLIEQVAAC